MYLDAVGIRKVLDVDSLLLKELRFDYIIPIKGRENHTIFSTFSPTKGPKVESRSADTSQLATLAPLPQ